VPGLKSVRSPRPRSGQAVRLRDGLASRNGHFAQNDNYVEGLAALASANMIEKDPELARAGGVPQLAQGLGFDLANALAGNVE